jgi:hypothetical protein
MRKKAIKKERLFLRQGTLTFPVFGYVVHFVETDDFDLATQHLKLGSHGAREVTEAMTWLSKKGDYAYIFIDKKCQPIGTIVHECWHVINAMLTFRGLDLKDEENVAYHLDFLVEKAMKFYKKEK